MQLAARAEAYVQQETAPDNHGSTGTTREHYDVDGAKRDFLSGSG